MTNKINYKNEPQEYQNEEQLYNEPSQSFASAFNNTTKHIKNISTEVFNRPKKILKMVLQKLQSLKL